MRLLHVDTLDFRFFKEEEVPPYAILSHTWGDEEVSYQDMSFLHKAKTLPEDWRNDNKFMFLLDTASGNPFPSHSTQAGYEKITNTARIAKSLDVEYFWVDTCCIDKSSSAELQEAINSMYRWYQRSAYCIVYLEDSGLFNADDQEFSDVLLHSRWITRGWTLQELIAPPSIVFYDSFWNYMTDKTESLEDISTATTVPQGVLATGDLTQASVAQKMSWAAKRTTTRIEDVAYSLMGIFQVHMPMLYGEGENAFIRLQEEIIRKTPDDSIFAWRSPGVILEYHRGLLARSPEEFRFCDSISKGNGNFSTSNLGLRLVVDLVAHQHPEIGECFLACLKAKDLVPLKYHKGPVDRPDQQQIILVLKRLNQVWRETSGEMQIYKYARVLSDAFYILDISKAPVVENIVIFADATLPPKRKEPIRVTTWPGVDQLRGLSVDSVRDLMKSLGTPLPSR